MLFTPPPPSAWSKADSVASDSGGYSIYADIYFADGTVLYGAAAAFSSGTHDWEYAFVELDLDRAVDHINLYCLFRYTTGTVR